MVVKGDVVLEIGSAHGDFAAACVTRHPPTPGVLGVAAGDGVVVVGVDIDIKMVAEARRRFPAIRFEVVSRHRVQTLVVKGESVFVLARCLLL